MADGYLITPRDGFFAKDARGWYAGQSGKAVGLPWPTGTTVRGALCTAIGREIETQNGAIHTPGEWLKLKRGIALRRLLALRSSPGRSPGIGDRVWQPPGDAVALKDGTWARLESKPLEAGAVLVDSGRDPRARLLEPLALDTREKPARGPRWWTEEEWVAWLLAKPSPRPSVPAQGAREPVARVDIHLKMAEQTGTADPGMLWQHETRETLIRQSLPRASESASPPPPDEFYHWSILAGVDLNIDAAPRPPRVATLGGDRKLADVACVEGLDACPDALASWTNRPDRLRVYCVTPACFENGWLPDGFAQRGNAIVGTLAGVEVRLVSAAVDRATPVGGWNMQHEDDELSDKPRNTTWAVPAGSMYLVERTNSEPFDTGILEQLWLQQWGTHTDDGYGLYCAGLDP